MSLFFSLGAQFFVPIASNDMVHHKALRLPVLALLISFQISIIRLVYAQTSTDDSTNNDDGGGSQNRDLDLFNYDTNQHTAEYFNFGPEDWGDIRCPDKDTCVRTEITKKFLVCDVICMISLFRHLQKILTSTFNFDFV